MSRLACLEVGGSGRQVVVFDDRGGWRLGDTSDLTGGAEVAVAVPGVIEAGRIVRASNLGWVDADPVEVLGLERPPAVLMNDAEAAALGEAVLAGQGTPRPLTFVGLGTGIGGAVVDASGRVEANLLGHAGRFGDRACSCGRTGCLETVAAGWALPVPLGIGDLVTIATALGKAIRDEPRASARLVVVAGGMARAHPALVGALAAELPRHTVRASHAPTALKSAAAFGLRHRAIDRVPA